MTTARRSISAPSAWDRICSGVGYHLDNLGRWLIVNAPAIGSTYAACLECSARYEIAPIRAAFLKDETLPLCNHCGGAVKTATISFGQSMPEDAMRLAQIETLQCDLFLAVDSSLVVYPAADFPLMAKDHGARLTILNRDPTELDRYADLVLNDEIGPVLGDLVGVN